MITKEKIDGDRGSRIKNINGVDRWPIKESAGNLVTTNTNNVTNGNLTITKIRLK